VILVTGGKLYPTSCYRYQEAGKESSHNTECMWGQSKQIGTRQEICEKLLSRRVVWRGVALKSADSGMVK
jgi:hypothetical protein